MATTTNYSWTTPDDTDLVKDGAAAIRTLGSSADTTVKNLNPGTTAGDIDYYTSGTAKARVGIGTAGQLLTVNAGATAPEWASPAPGGGMTLLSTTTLSGATTTISAISGSHKDLLLILQGVSNSSGATFAVRVNGITTGTYNGIITQGDASPFVEVYRNNQTAMVANVNLSTNTDNSGYLKIYDYASTNAADKYMEFRHFDASARSFQQWDFTSTDTGGSAITSITFLASSGTIAGTVLTYGVS